MMKLSTTNARTLIAVPFALALTLSACAAPSPEQLFIDGLEEQIEQQAGGDVDVDFGGLGGASLPEGFPANVPLPQAPLVSAVAVDGGFGLVYAGVQAEAANAYVEQLRAQGFVDQADLDYGAEAGAWSLSDGTTLVTIFAAYAGADSVLSLGVTAAP